MWHKRSLQQKMFLKGLGSIILTYHYLFDQVLQLPLNESETVMLYGNGAPNGDKNNTMEQASNNEACFTYAARSTCNVKLFDKLEDLILVFLLIRMFGLIGKYLMVQVRFQVTKASVIEVSVKAARIISDIKGRATPCQAPSSDTFMSLHCPLVKLIDEQIHFSQLMNCLFILLSSCIICK